MCVWVCQKLSQGLCAWSPSRGQTGSSLSSLQGYQSYLTWHIEPSESFFVVVIRSKEGLTWQLFSKAMFHLVNFLLLACIAFKYIGLNCFIVIIVISIFVLTRVFALWPTLVTPVCDNIFLRWVRYLSGSAVSGGLITALCLMEQALKDYGGLWILYVCHSQNNCHP